MAYKDGGEFTTYCDKYYDKHIYRVHLKGGRTIDFDSYELMRYHWYQGRELAVMVEVIDITAGKGF